MTNAQGSLPPPAKAKANAKALLGPFIFIFFKAIQAAQRTWHLTQSMLWAVGGAVVKVVRATWRMRNASARSAQRAQREREGERKRWLTSIRTNTSGMWHVWHVARMTSAKQIHLPRFCFGRRIPRCLPRDGAKLACHKKLPCRFCRKAFAVEAAR